MGIARKPLTEYLGESEVLSPSFARAIGPATFLSLCRAIGPAGGVAPRRALRGLPVGGPPTGLPPSSVPPPRPRDLAGSLTR
jgi:hypothetical protein